MKAPAPEDRQQAIDVLAQQFVNSGKSPEDAQQAATAIIDHAIAERAAR